MTWTCGKKSQTGKLLEKPGKKSLFLWNCQNFPGRPTFLDEVQYFDPMDTTKNPKYYMSKPSCRVEEEPTQTAHGVAGCVAKPKQISRMPGTWKKRCKKLLCVRSLWEQHKQQNGDCMIFQQEFFNWHSASIVKEDECSIGLKSNGTLLNWG